MNLQPSTPAPAPAVAILPGVDTVLVYGYGISGQSAADLLLRHGFGVVAVDARDLDEDELGASDGFRFEREDRLRELPPEVGAVVLSPGVPPDKPLVKEARAAAVPVLGEVELAYRLLRGPLVGITGTNGKSTTTELCGAMLRAAGKAVEVCGNIGRPLSARVGVEGLAQEPGSAGEASDEREAPIYVTELSSFQLEALSTVRCRAAALLNVAPDHLDRYTSFEEYAAAKGHLFDRQTVEDVAVVNAGDPLTQTLARRSPARVRTFSSEQRVEDGCYLEHGWVVEVAPGTAPLRLFAVADIPLAGVHNLENAMAAALLARAFGAEPESMRLALAGFRALPHRMERVAVVAGVEYWDDSKATNVAAALRSLEGMDDGRVHLILGGIAKGDDLRSLVLSARSKARTVWLIGEAAAVFEEAFADSIDGSMAGPRGDSAGPAVKIVRTLDAAVLAAAAAAQAGDAVLLAPACASYDQFPSFAARGDRFAEVVRSLERSADAGGDPQGEEADDG